MNWQPIETFDGGEDEADSVLIVVDGMVGEGIWRGREWGWWWINVHPTDYCSGEPLQPTYWMPLPSPPLPVAREAQLDGSEADTVSDGEPKIP